MDFSQPQRLSAKGLVIMYVYQVQALVRSTWYLILIFLLKAERSHIVLAGIGLSLIMVVSAFFAWRRYMLFTFHINEAQGEFVLQSGLLSKNTLVIQLDKIQQVHIKQGFLQQLIGVHTLHIDTAGSAQDEAQLKALHWEVAQALQTRLQQQTGIGASTDTTQAEVPNASSSTYQLPWTTLLKVGLTSKYRQSLGLITFAFFTTYNSLQEAERLIPQDWVDTFEQQWLPMLAVFLPVVIVLSLVVLLVFNVIRTLVVFYGYTIESKGNNILLKYGLLSKQIVLLRPKRTQWLSRSQNPLQRLLGLTDVVVHQVRGGQHDKATQKHWAEVPGCDPKTVAHFQQLFAPIPTRFAHTLHPNWRKMLLPTLSVWLVLSVVFYTVILPVWGQILLVFLGVLTPFWQYLRFRKSRFLWQDNSIQIRAGVWDVVDIDVEVYKIQSLRLRQYAWHRHLDIGHVRICTSAGSLHFTFASYAALRQWINAALYRIESSRRSWM